MCWRFTSSSLSQSATGIETGLCSVQTRSNTRCSFEHPNLISLVEIAVDPLENRFTAKRRYNIMATSATKAGTSQPVSVPSSRKLLFRFVQRRALRTKVETSAFVGAFAEWPVFSTQKTHNIKSTIAKSQFPSCFEEWL